MPSSACLFVVIRLAKFTISPNLTLIKKSFFKIRNNHQNSNSKLFFRKIFNMSTETKKLKSEPLKIGTHSGVFHCDEILACFMLQQLDKYKNAEIVRSRDLDILKTCDIVVDVGDVFSVESNRFDHHQRSFNETLSSLKPEMGAKYNIKLSSAGLIYTYFGEEIIAAVLKKHKSIILDPDSLRAIYKKVYENLIEEIDAIDNGVQICDGEPRYRITTNLSARVGNFYPAWNCEEEIDENVQFEKAKELVGDTFVDKVLYYTISWLPAREIVKDAIKNASNVHESGEILELSKPCPFKEHLFDLEKEYDISGKPKYVLMKGNDDFRVICVPIQPTSFICRKPLHKDWRGIRSDKLIEISKIEDAIFCHNTGFIGGAKSREGTLKMAIESLNGDYTN